MALDISRGSAILIGATALAAGAMALGCGGDDSGQRDPCGQVAPCGGDIVGSWQAAGSCVDAASEVAQLGRTFDITCPDGAQMSLRSSTIARNISASFLAEGTYSGTSTVYGSHTVDIPVACLGGKSCADLDAAFRATVDPPRTNVIGAGCTGDTTCACQMSLGGTTTETGSYSVMGTALETSPSGGVGGGVTSYCVTGTRLHFISIDPSGAVGPTGEPRIGSDTVLQRL